MKQLLFLFAMILSITCYAQVSDEAQNSVCTNPESFPEFKGGPVAMHNYLINNIKYPVEAKSQCITGMVYVQFLVGENGTVRDVKIAKGIGYGCDEEAMRVVSEMPAWNPGTENDKAVAVMCNLPIKFKMADCEVKEQPED